MIHIISYVANVILFIACVFLYCIARLNNNDLRSEIKIKDQTLEACESLRIELMANLIATQNSAIKLVTQAKVIDTKVKSLVTLAVHSSNEHESRSAALEACKRINRNLNT